eukprot:1159484-Pelagomonas_calceolata.AAC.1
MGCTIKVYPEGTKGLATAHHRVWTSNADNSKAAQQRLKVVAANNARAETMQTMQGQGQCRQCKGRDKADDARARQMQTMQGQGQCRRRKGRDNADDARAGTVQTMQGQTMQGQSLEVPDSAQR